MALARQPVNLDIIYMLCEKYIDEYNIDIIMENEREFELNAAMIMMHFMVYSYFLTSIS